MTKDGRARVRAPFVVPALDGRPVFTELKTGKAHDRAYIVFTGTPVTPDAVLSRLHEAPPDPAAARRRIEVFLEQLSSFKLGCVVAVEPDGRGLPVLRKVADHPQRAAGRHLPG
jgi:hypothetical protein